MSIQIITDSASDISAAQAAKWNVTVLPLTTIFGDEAYLDGVTLDHKTFYEKLIETDVMPTTSQLSPAAYESAFRSALEKGGSVLCFTVSSKLSGCCQSAHIAAAEVDGDIVIVDTLSVSLGMQTLIEMACTLRDEGKTASEIAAILEEEKQKLRVIALVDTLEYLKRGGRISPTTALAGSLLNIKPVIALENGEIIMCGKARGSKNANNLLASLIAKDGIDFSKPCYLAYSGLSDTLLQKYVADSAHLYEGRAADFPVVSIGSTIGTHAGPGAIAVAFFAKN